MIHFCIVYFFEILELIPLFWCPGPPHRVDVRLAHHDPSCQVHPRPCSLAVGSGWGFLMVVKVASIVCCHRAWFLGSGESLINTSCFKLPYLLANRCTHYMFLKLNFDSREKPFLWNYLYLGLMPYFDVLHVRLISHLSNRGKPESRGALPVHYPVIAGLRSGRLHQSLVWPFTFTQRKSNGYNMLKKSF